MVLCLTLGIVSPVLSILAAYNVFGNYSTPVSITLSLMSLFLFALYLYLIVYIVLRWKTINNSMFKKCIWEWLGVLICVLLCYMAGSVYWDTYQPALYRSSSTDCFKV